MSLFQIGKYLKVNRSVDGLRGERRRFRLPAGGFHLGFGFLMRGRLPPDYFHEVKSTRRASERGGRETPGGILF